MRQFKPFLLLLSLATVAPAVASGPSAEDIARAHVKALNDGTPAAMSQFIKTYCASNMKTWVKGMMQASHELAPVTLNKIVFSAPYEFIAETTDRRKRTDHMTFFLNNRNGKVRWLITYWDSK